MVPRTQAYFDWIFAKQAMLVTSNGYKVMVTPTDSMPSIIPTDGKSDYPVRPTHHLQIDFVRNQYESTSIILYAVLDGELWREVLPCPRGDVVARAREKQSENSARRQIASKIEASLSTTVRDQVESLLAEGKKVEAIRHLSSVTGSDIGTAKDVVDLMLSRGGIK